MKRKEFQVGETVQCGLTTLHVVEQGTISNCCACFFDALCSASGGKYIDNITKIAGACCGFERSDKKNVIFIEQK